MNYFADLCWPFHELVIARLQPRVILFLGQAAGNYVRARIGANILCGEFVENNRRKWRSRAFVNPVGIKVVTATHPSIADWTNSSTDPSQLVRESLNRQSL
jgi:uracil-DNA glycosylase